MGSPFLGQIILFAGNFAPRGWAFCNGQTLSISQSTALFSILGTTYGGNGQTNFNLPDLRSRVPLHSGQGAGLSSYVLGQTSGTENVTLTTPQMPAHNHMVNADATNGSAPSPSGGNLAQSVVPPPQRGGTPTVVNTYTTGTPGQPVQLAATTITGQGGNQPHTNIQPLLALNYIIALEGIFPTRN